MVAAKGGLLVGARQPRSGRWRRLLLLGKAPKCPGSSQSAAAVVQEEAGPDSATAAASSDDGSPWWAAHRYWSAPGLRRRVL